MGRQSICKSKVQTNTPVLIVPAVQTLKRYGLTQKEWIVIWKKQKGLCLICKLPRRLVTDHEHVKGWKNMPPEQRKLYVRGLLCHFCNYRILRKGNTIDKFANAIKYLKAFDRLQESRLRLLLDKPASTIPPTFPA